uniref:DUF148 domain-containing protein n=1 Tax=Steinernema glaseri TaxID=37863 RepID=A0A1I8ANE4_9BILA
MNGLLVLSLLLVGAAAQTTQQTFFDNDDIDDLQKFVDYPTKMTLKALEQNPYIPRSQKKEQFEQILNSQSQQVQILNSQSQQVQDAFRQKQTYENMKRQQKLASLQQRMQWMPPAVANAYKQILEAKNDLSLSDMEYNMKKQQIWAQVNPRDRYAGGSHSSEEIY